MPESSFGKGFYLDGPMGSDNWSVYVCCGRQDTYDQLFSYASKADSCSCSEPLLMKVRLREAGKFLIVDVNLTAAPKLSFTIPERIAAHLRRHFLVDNVSNSHAYASLVDSLFKHRLHHVTEDYESIAVIQGFIAYLSWVILALAGHPVGQKSFTTLFSQIGLGVTSFGVTIPAVTKRILAEGETVVTTGDGMVTALTRYKTMLALDTVQQCLLSCGITPNPWLKTILTWNRCVRGFFYDCSDLDSDLTSSAIHGMIMSFSNYLGIVALKEQALDQRLSNIENFLTAQGESSLSQTTTSKQSSFSTFVSPSAESLSSSSSESPSSSSSSSSSSEQGYPLCPCDDDPPNPSPVRNKPARDEISTSDESPPARKAAPLRHVSRTNEPAPKPPRREVTVVANELTPTTVRHFLTANTKWHMPAVKETPSTFQDKQLTTSAVRAALQQETSRRRIVPPRISKGTPDRPTHQYEFGD